jgi:hypothetical protein
MGLLGRYVSERDFKFMRSINNELLYDIVQTICTYYKISPLESNTNVYGESVQNEKVFYIPQDIPCYIRREDINNDEAVFYGPDRTQNTDFFFLEEWLKKSNLYPEIGDIISFNQRYYECDNVVQEQFLGGIAEKSLSIVCHTHYTRLSKINTISRQV